MSDFKLSDATQRKLDNAGESFAYNLRQVTFADPRPARLGNGEQPATVVIPPAKRRDGCTLYAYFEVDQTREVIQIANTNAGITFDNSNAGLPILIAKPFGSTVYHIVSFDPNSLNDVSGGILPAQAMQKYGFILTPDRWQDLQPVPQGDMTVGITAGIVMINHVLYPILATDNFSGDLTSYIPATAGMSKWVIVEYDGSAVSILQGSEFVPSGLSNSDALPTALTEGKEPLFAVYLFNGQTEVEKRQLLPLKTFHKSFASSLIGLSDTPSSYGTAGQVLQVNAGADGLEFGAGGASTDELVAVSANDTTPGYLLGKLAAGTRITLAEVNDGGDEDLSVAIDASTDAAITAAASHIADVTTNPHAVTLEQARTEDNTVAGNIDFAGYMALAMACDNGSTLPTSPTPVLGQWFLHTPTGRSVLMMYDGADWQPIMSFGTMTMYVDGTSGSDVPAGGGASGASAFATLQYAIDRIPGSLGGNVTIYVAGGNYASATIQGKSYRGSYGITIEGTLNTAKSGTVGVGSVQGTGATAGTVVDNAGGMTVNAYAGKLLIFDASTTTVALQGQIRVIDSNTATTFALCGCNLAAPASGDTYTVKDWSSIINSGGIGFSIQNGQLAVTIKNMQITSPSIGILVQNNSVAVIDYCRFLTYTASGVYIQKGSEATVKFGTFEPNSGTQCILAYGHSRAFVRNSRLKNTSAVGIGLYLSASSFVVSQSGTVIDTFGVGIFCSGARAELGTVSAEGTTKIRNSTTGAQAIGGGQIVNTDAAHTTYSGNTTNENPSGAANPSYID